MNEIYLHKFILEACARGGHDGITLATAIAPTAPIKEWKALRRSVDRVLVVLERQGLLYRDNMGWYCVMTAPAWLGSYLGTPDHGCAEPSFLYARLSIPSSTYIAVHRPT